MPQKQGEEFLDPDPEDSVVVEALGIPGASVTTSEGSVAVSLPGTPTAHAMSLHAACEKALAAKKGAK